ncbi:MAG TPA: RHS repeat-associated core domain-containing protein, partial [Saprospiraceae bacterium]|nr:RHS repeat-associated core domain-containing protein [Saprospiraceae bacterium]
LQNVNLGGGGIAYYVYDSSGQRNRKVIERLDGSKEERIYLGGFELFRKKDNSSNITEETETFHVMDDSRRIAMVETKTIKNGVSFSEQLVRYQYGNHLGSSSLELDDKAMIISYEEYHPYGTTSYQAKSAAINAAAKRYRYTGMERDDESGLEYHKARYYLPWLGRWLSADPIGIGGGINLYAYAGNNPVTRTDTKGTDWKEDIFGDIKKAQVTTTDYGAITAKGHLIAYDKQGHPGDRIFVPFGQNKPTYIHTQKNWFKITSIEGDKVNFESVDKPSGVWIRISGLGEMISGALGTAGGVVFGVATAETGVGSVAGAAFSTWSADHAIRGARNFWNGEEHRTFTANILSNVMSDRAADATDDIAYFVASMAVTVANAKLPSTKLPPTSSGEASVRASKPLPTPTIKPILSDANANGLTYGNLTSRQTGKWKWWKYRTPEYNPTIELARYPQGPTTLAKVEAHELKHANDFLNHPQASYLATSSRLPGRGIAAYIFEARGYYAEYGLKGIMPKYVFGSLSSLEIRHLAAEVTTILALGGYQLVKHLF